ncbi:hypothetical protein PYW07_006992 [Mythimna separata]|uniref:Uncharacterized protein n=1 Tax=Mythimna separata TaxID=271217 RepID=A0AAD8DZM4_MYTSE|nr:hypothetical protein PYW07_006992 [Mythimna separata]
MAKYLALLVLSGVLCFVNGWVVFPLPDAPAPVNTVKPTPVLPRFPVPTSTGFTNNFVKPTPVFPAFPVASTTANVSPNKLNTSFSPVLSTQDVSVPSVDLLPPKTEYVEYEP